MPVNSFDNYPLTWVPDKSRLTPPYYLSLAKDLEERIKNGSLQAGVKLPPQRELADYLDLNYTTITRVYNLCKKKGLIYGITGKGTFVAPHTTEDITLTSFNLSNSCIEFGTSNSFSEHNPLVEKAIRTVLDKGYMNYLWDYSHPSGHPHQLAAGVRWMEQLSVHTDIDHTAIFTGSQNALTVALISLFSAGDKIATDQYTYSNFIELAHLLQLVLVPIAGDTNGMLPSELKKQCTTNKIKGIYLMPSGSNPTNTYMPLERRQELAKIIKEENLILIEDDIAAWMRAVEKCPLPSSIFDMLTEQSIYLCATTKNLCPGLRIAYAAFSDDLKERILHGIFNINVKTSSFNAEVVTELFLNGDAYKIMEKKWNLANKTCQLFDQYFPECRQENTPVGYYRWLPIHTDKPFPIVEEELLKRGIRVFHSARFSVANIIDQNYLRVSLCSTSNMKTLEKGLRILKEYLEE